MAKKYLQEKLIAGENITIAADGKTISATGGGSEPAAYVKEVTKSGNTYTAVKKDGSSGESWTIPTVDVTKSYVDTELAKKVTTSIKDDQNATNVIDNSKGQNGAVMQTMLADTNGTIVSFNTASENGADGILAQVYAKNTTGADIGKGMRLNFTKTGAYYGVGTSTPIDADHELAVKKDVSDEATARYNADQATDAKVQVLENALDHKLSLFKFEKAPGTDQPVRMTYYFDKVTDAEKATITAYTLQMNNTSQSTPETFTMDVESATTTTAGLMSAADKTKLDSLTPSGVEAIELEVRPVSGTKSEGTLTEEQFNKLKSGLNPIHLKVYMGGTEYRYYVDINQYWYDNNSDKIGANVILMNYSSDSIIIAKLWAIADTSTEPATYKLELTSDDFEYSKWIKSTELDNKTIVKNTTTNKYETAIGGYMETGLIPHEPYICWELALNQWATNPKVWFVTDEEYVMQVGDTVTAIILDQDTGNKWTITNATVATYTIDGVEHIGVQYSEPKSGPKELYVLRWNIDGEEKVVVYNNDDKIVLHNGAILTAYKMVEGQVPHVMDGKFLPIDGTTIVYNETENYIHAVAEVTKKEFEMLSEEVAEKIDESQLQSAIATREAVGVCYTKTESDGKYQPILTDTSKLDPTKINWSTAQSSVLESGITSTLVGQIPSTSAQSAWSAKADAFTVDGTTIKWKSTTERELQATIPSALVFKGTATAVPTSGMAAGDMWFIGTAQPYDVYIYTDSSTWANVGKYSIDISAKADADNSVLTGAGTFETLTGSVQLAMGNASQVDFSKAGTVKLPDTGITALGGTLSTEDLVFTLADSTEVTVSVVKKVSA